MKVICVIPARYASTRLPGKPLKLIGGKPMIQRVYEQAKKAARPAEVIVATDDSRVYDAVIAFGGCACMTREDHPNGTSRLAEVAEKYPDVKHYSDRENESTYDILGERDRVIEENRRLSVEGHAKNGVLFGEENMIVISYWGTEKHRVEKKSQHILLFLN